MSERSERLAAIRERAEAAQPGPWEVDGLGVYPPGDRRVGVAMAPFESDRDFIAHAREDIEWLLSLIEDDA